MEAADKKLVFIGVGLGLILGMFYIAQRNSPEQLASVPQFETEEQFSGLSSTGVLDNRVNPGTPLDMSHQIHFFGVDDCCPGQQLVSLPHRYPLVSGINFDVVMNHGLTAMAKGSPDNDWRVQPPSEYTL